MYLPSLIGSILSFKNTGIGQQELDIISGCCEDTLDFILADTINQLYYELSDYDEYFSMHNCHIVISETYGYDSLFLRKRFFESLDDDDKCIIYSILNMI